LRRNQLPNHRPVESFYSGNLCQKGIATMADDARISTALPQHPKTVKLQRRLGTPGCWSLICLFLWVADNRPEGDLQGMTAEDIEIAANWAGATGSFVSTLAEVRFLDGQEGAYNIHDWAEHNPWAATRPERTRSAKKAAAARWGKMQSASDPHATPCEPHETAMPSSPLLISPPNTLEPNPPLLENRFVHSKEKNFSQSDFDARDLRKLANAREELQLKLTNGWGSSLSNEEIWEHQCILAGISVQQAEEVIERTKKRPQAQMLGASA
jgi:hypothetical protein